MREGDNPGKTQDVSGSVGAVRVIIPVFMPSTEGYFDELMPIFELSLRSITGTAGPAVRTTVVANGCAPAIRRDLEERLERGEIDDLVVHRHNLGKVDAALSGARATYEDLVVITDCDVLFRAGWLPAAVEIFRTFPECGFLGLTPLPNLVRHATSTTVLEAGARRELTTAAVVDPTDLRQFADSIGNPALIEGLPAEQLVVRRDGVTACVGAGHFCYLTRRRAIASLPTEPCANAPLGEQNWLDLPPDEQGYWRLSTTHAFALHLGNKQEPWMAAELDAALAQPVLPVDVGQLPAPHPSLVRAVPHRLRNGVARRLADRILSAAG